MGEALKLKIVFHGEDVKTKEIIIEKSQIVLELDGEIIDQILLVKDTMPITQLDDLARAALILIQKKITRSVREWLQKPNPALARFMKGKPCQI
jgi:hypothetical protein